MARRSDINWKSIELEFRLGLLPVRQLAKKHQVSDSNLRAKAKREGWTREEGEVARAAARDAVAAETTQAAREIGAAIGAEQAQLYRQALEDSVLTSLEVTREHQLLVRRGMQSAMQLLVEVECASSVKELSDLERERCRDDDAARAAVIDRHLGLKGRVETFDRWATDFSKLAAVEREAHNLGSSDKATGIDELLLKVRADRERSLH